MPEAYIRKTLEEDWNSADCHEVWLVTILGKTLTFPTHHEAVEWCKALKLRIKEDQACGAV
jgi:hypothetical protein